MQVMMLLADAAGAGEPEYMNSPVIVAAGVVTVACVVLHYEVIALLIKALVRFRVKARLAIAAVVLTLLLTHLVEISLFAVAHQVLLSNFGSAIGGVEGQFDGSMLDLFYFSIAVYTTVGFGDITPEGPLRILTGVEALAGLMLVTWSASFTFLIMQRYWEATAKPIDPANHLRDGDDGAQGDTDPGDAEIGGS